MKIITSITKKKNQGKRKEKKEVNTSVTKEEKNERKKTKS